MQIAKLHAGLSMVGSNGWVLFMLCGAQQSRPLTLVSNAFHEIDKVGPLVGQDDEWE